MLKIKKLIKSSLFFKSNIIIHLNFLLIKLFINNFLEIQIIQHKDKLNQSISYILVICKDRKVFKEKTHGLTTYFKKEISNLYKIFYIFLFLNDKASLTFFKSYYNYEI